MTHPDGFPRVLLVGAPKAGTTAIYHWLGSVPSTASCSTKEFHYLSGLSENVSGYLSSFSGPGFRTDCSTSAIHFADAVIRRHPAIAEVTIVAVLRDPLDRAWSHWRYAIKIGQERRSLDELFSDDFLTPDDPWGTPRAYTDLSHYASGLKLYGDAGASLILIDKEELGRNPAGALAPLAALVGAEAPQVLSKRNVSVTDSERVVGRLLLALARHRWVSSRPYPTPLRRLAWSIIGNNEVSAINQFRMHQEESVHLRFEDELRHLRELFPYFNPEWLR
jgi:hypothetical protein